MDRLDQTTKLFRLLHDSAYDRSAVWKLKRCKVFPDVKPVSRALNCLQLDGRQCLEQGSKIGYLNLTGSIRR